MELDRVVTPLDRLIDSDKLIFMVHFWLKVRQPEKLVIYGTYDMKEHN